MPVQTAIQVRRGTASSWTSTNPTLAAGEIGFETDTGKFKIGTGSTAWASLAYAAIDAGLLAAKGDLVTATANDTPAVLTVGSNGDTLVADSSATTGLRWQGNFAAGKNKIINGDFNIWQRGTSFNLVSGSTSFFADRFSGRGDSPSGTPSVTRQTFTAGAAPVAGYEGQYFLRYTTGGNVTVSIGQAIEDVRTLAGQTITVSFWMKTSTAKTLSMLVRQSFGSGGSGDVDQFFNYTTSTSWQRFTQTLTLGSLSGKTIGTNSHLLLQMVQYQSVTGNFDIDIWGVQVEAGNTATAFQTATGTLAGEVLACQRYYWRWTAGDAYTGFGLVIKTTTTAANWYLQNPVEMRARPSSLEFSTLMLGNGAASAAVTAMTLGWWSKNSARVDITNNAFGAGDTPAGIFANNSTSAYFAINAEL